MIKKICFVWHCQWDSSSFMHITPVSQHTWYEPSENSEQDFKQTEELQQFTESSHLYYW
jgi:hypothetical protein